MSTKIVNTVTENMCYGDGFNVRYSIDVQFEVKTSEAGVIEFFNDKVISRYLSVEKGNSYRESTDKDYIVKATPSKIIALYKKFNHDINVETIKRYDEQAIEESHTKYLNETLNKVKDDFKKELSLLLDKYKMKLELSNFDLYGSSACLDFIHVPTNRKDTLMLADEGECVTFE